MVWPFSKKADPEPPAKIEAKKAARLPARLPRSRGYAAATIGRLTNDWTTFSGTPAAEIQAALAISRARSRDLANNNAYARRFLNMAKTNVIGHKGIQLQIRARSFSGVLDEPANNRIEESWLNWGKVGSPTVDGRLSWIDTQRLFIETLIKDGEVLIRKWPAWKENPHRFAIQFIECDHLDGELNQIAINGNRIVMGVEVNKWDRPVAYHLLVKHPGETFPGQFGKKHERVPASEMLHIFVTERAKQPRGVPWMVPSMLRNKILDGLEEAAVTAARIGASKMGFFKSPGGDGYVGDDEETGASGATVQITEMEPGVFEQLPADVEFQGWDPTYPNNEYAPFAKSILRGIAAGWNVSYVSLANDLEGVSYSSIRKGELEDRDNWQCVQTFAIEHFCGPIQEQWLEMALISGALNLPFAKFDKFNAPVWRPRGWKWVDPDRETKAQERAIKNSTVSYEKIVAEGGEDARDVITSNAELKAFAESSGLTLPIFEDLNNGKEKQIEPGVDDTDQDN